MLAMKPKQDAVVRATMFDGLVSELKKVSWPTRHETTRLTIMVLVISLIIGFYVGIIDVLLAKALEILTKAR